MTSPVDTSVKYYSSAMANAPVLSGTAGALIGLLDACLKDGFDTRTLTSLVVAGGVATATFPGTHAALVDSVVLIAGVTGALTALNGEQKIVTKPGATSVTFATAAADGTAAGTITMKMAPAGWAKPHSGTNKAVYKSIDPASTGMLLRIDDTATTFVRVVGYEAMTDVDNGTGPFPTAVQMSGGGYWAKSAVASSAAVSWSIIADSRSIYVNILAGTSSNVGFLACPNRSFGDLAPYRASGDNYACMLNYSIQPTVHEMTDGGLGASGSACALPREYTGLGAAVVSTVRAFVGTGTSGADSTFGAFPSAVDGGLWMADRYVSVSGNTQPRAKLRGVAGIPQTGVASTIKQENVVPGAGALLGRNFVMSNACANSGTSFGDNSIQGAVLFDVTGPWS